MAIFFLSSVKYNLIDCDYNNRAIPDGIYRNTWKRNGIPDEHKLIYRIDTSRTWIKRLRLFLQLLFSLLRKIGTDVNLLARLRQQNKLSINQYNERDKHWLGVLYSRPFSVESHLSHKNGILPAPVERVSILIDCECTVMCTHHAL